MNHRWNGTDDGEEVCKRCRVIRRPTLAGILYLEPGLSGWRKERPPCMPVTLAAADDLPRQRGERRSSRGGV